MSKEAYRHVLVGTDFSDASQRAVEAAGRVAQRWGAHVTLVHVYEPTPFYQGVFPGTALELREKIEAAARAELEAVAARALSGVSTDLRAIASRSPAGAFCDEAAERRADLCITGTHGRAGIERLLIGSVAEKIVRHAPCDVLTVPRHAAGSPPFGERILIATDFSEASQRAAEAALRFCANGTELCCVHVFDDSIPVPAAGGGFESRTQIAERYARELDDWCARVFPGARALPREVIADARAARALTQRATDWKAELLVVGRHGRTGAAHLLIGSVAERTIRHAPCAVLCVSG